MTHTQHDSAALPQPAAGAPQRAVATVEGACRKARWPGRALRFAAALGLAFGLAACGGGSGGSDGAAGSGGNAGSGMAADGSTAVDATTPSAHTASLDAIGAAYDRLAQTDPAADGEALLALVKTLPDVRESGIAAPGNVWLTFDDGVSTFISTVPLYTPAEAAAVAATAVAAAAPDARAATSTAPGPQARALDTKLPGSATPDVRHAYLIDSASLGLTKWSRVDTMKGWFERRKFTVHAADNRTDPAIFKTIKGASVAHLLTHGSVGVIDGKHVFGLTIGLEAAVEQNRAFYANEIKVTHEMGYMVVPEPHEVAAGNAPKQRMGKYLYFTPQFVRNNMSFTEGSLVFLNGCGTFTADAADMVQAFKDVHATTVIGWTSVVDHAFAIDAALFLFDRLLSANEHAGYTVQPPNRPFTVSEVLDHMSRRAHVAAAYPFDYPPDAPHDLTLTQSVFRVYRDNGTKYTAYNAALMADATHGYEGFALVPAITGLYVENLQDRLTLNGNFGAGPSAAGAGTRQVTLDDKPLTVQSWSASQIVVQNVPRTGAGSSGALVVKVDGAESNMAFVDRWNDVVLKNYQPFPGGSGDGTGTAVTLAQCTVSLRGSSSSFRNAIDGDLTLFASTDDAVIQDGSCGYNAYGEYFGAGYQVTFAVAGSPLLPWLTPVQRNSLDLFTRYAFVTANISNGNLQFDLIARTRLSDAGGPRQNYRYHSTGQIATSAFELNSTGATEGSRSGAFQARRQHAARGSVQQTLNPCSPGARRRQRSGRCRLTHVEHSGVRRGSARPSAQVLRHPVGDEGAGVAMLSRLTWCTPPSRSVKIFSSRFGLLTSWS